MDEPAFLFCSEPISLSEVEALKAAHAAFFAALRLGESPLATPTRPRWLQLRVACPSSRTTSPLLPPGGERIDKMNVLDACWQLLSILAVAAAAADAHRQLPRMSQNVPT